MSKVFVISDTHFGHEAMLGFKRTDGSPVRDFPRLDDMHQHMVVQWNTTVGKDDLVLHLGDVAFSGQAYDTIMPLLNGKKYLIRGNHDRFSEGRYRKHFNRVLGCYVRDRYVFTHVPIHPDSMARWELSIHGHLHTNKIEDDRYFCACVEQIGYTPIDFEVIKRINQSQPKNKNI